MIKYAVMLNPGHNRVYFQNSKSLSLCEAELASKSFSVKAENFEIKEIAGICYLTFSAEGRLNEEDLTSLARLSFFYAVFEISEDEKSFYPVLASENLSLDKSLSTILKYQGKTNELFTRLLLNAAYFSLKDKPAKVKLLDPVAGKGTTLFEGILMGFDGSGLELNEKSANEGYHYFKKFLETERVKHTSHLERVSGEGKSFTGKSFGISFYKDEEARKAKEALNWEIVSADSFYANKIFKKNSFDIIAGDLPYGIQHGNFDGKNQGASKTRNPSEMIKRCLPSWKAVLKKDGVIALSWNSLLIKREDLGKILEKEGFEVLNESPYNNFTHRVDSSIERDIIIGVKL